VHAEFNGDNSNFVGTLRDLEMTSTSLTLF